MTALSRSPELVAWNRSVASLLDDVQEMEASPQHAPPLDDLAASPTLRAALDEVLADDEALADTIALAIVADDTVSGDGSLESDETERPLSEAELEVLRQFVVILGVGHVSALVIVLSMVTGLGLIVGFSVLAGVAQLAGYSLRDFVRPSSSHEYQAGVDERPEERP